MKKVLSLIALMVFIVSTAQAGYSSNTRSKCRWWAKRFAANGHISAWCGIGYNYSSSHSGDCDFAQIHFSRNFCRCSGTATVHSQNGWGGAWGYFNGACNMNGGLLSDLFLELNDGGGGGTTPTGNGYDPATIESRMLPNINPGDVNIDGISVKMSSDVADPFLNTFTVGIWLPQDDTLTGVEDTVYDANKAIIEGKVVLQNGNLMVTGDLFTPQDFQVMRNGTRVEVTYVGGPKNVQIPAGINSDDLAVTAIGDVVDNQQHKFSTATGEHNGVIAGNLDFTAYPNPAGNVLNLSIKSPEAANVTVGVYNAEGKLVQQQKEVQVASGTSATVVNMSALAAGRYFILIEGSGIKVVKQVTKQ